MSIQTTIIDDVFVGGHIKGRKHTVREVMGMGECVVRQGGHGRYYSREFVPFVLQRDVKGRLIKSQQQQMPTQSKPQHLIRLSCDNEHSPTPQPSKTTLSIGTKFSLHQISHFRSVRLTSHVDKLPILRKELQRRESRVPERIGICVPMYEVIQSSPTEDIIEQTQNMKSSALTIINNTTTARQRRRRTSSLRQLAVSHPQPPSKPNNPTPHQRSTSLNTLIKTTRHKNPQLLQIQRNVKVHYNHPQLERLKQSRNLTFKCLENIQKGEKVFRQKVMEYRAIKERIKREMNKLL